jgi:hypothetical protein
MKTNCCTGNPCGRPTLPASLEHHRLKSKTEIDALRLAMGEKFAPFHAGVIRLLDQIPKNTWYDFTKSVHPSNYKAFIKLVCHYIDQHRTIYDDVEFNETFTRIRRVVWSEPKTPCVKSKRHEAK